MPKIEKKMTEFIEKHLSLLYFIAISAVAFYIRIIGRHFLSGDMDTFLLSWFEQMQDAGGLHGLREQIGDYNILYQTFIALMTYIPLNPMTMYKALSCVFDIGLAVAAAYFVCDLKSVPKWGRLFNTVYTVIILLPTVVLNSAYWGQCDSMYAFCILIAVCLLYREKHIPAFVFLGLSFAFKLQTVFVLPFFLAVYFVRKRFSIAMFLISLLSFWLSGGVAYIFGRDLLAPFKVYLEQTSTYRSMYMCSRSIWLVFGNEYDDFGRFAIILTLSLCAVGFYMILDKAKKIDSPDHYFSALAYFIWSCIFFLPAMHDRYAYPLDIVIIVLAFLDKRYIKFAVFSAFFSFMSYAPFLVHANGLYREDAFIELFVFAWFVYTVFNRSEDKMLKEVKDSNGR